MLSIVLNKWVDFKNIIIQAEQILDEINIEVDSDGLRFNALDRPHVCYFGANFKKDAFDEFQCDAPLTISLDTSEFVNVLKRGKSNETLILEANEYDLILIFKGKSERKFNIIQMDLDYTEQQPPNVNYPVVLNMDYDVINESIKDASLYSDSLTFTVKNNILNIHTTGAFGEYSNKISLENHYDNEYTSCFSLSHLEKIFKVKMKSKGLEISLGNVYPIYLKLNMDENIQVTSLLAPKIEQEEEL